MANLTTIFRKKMDEECPEDYQAISLTSVVIKLLGKNIIDKLLEGIIIDKIVDFL